MGQNVNVIELIQFFGNFLGLKLHLDSCPRMLTLPYLKVLQRRLI